MNPLIAVNELYGPVYQGEGRNFGMPAMFLRLSACNLSCKWCDTPYTWDWTGKNGVAYNPKLEVHNMSTSDVIRELSLLSSEVSHNLVITGGEPMLQQNLLASLVNELHLDDWWIEIETAGTIVPHPEFKPDQYTVSLKLANSGNPIEKRYQPKAIKAYVNNYRSVFKFVASSLEDFREIDALCSEFDITPDIVYIMPEGTNAQSLEEHLNVIAEEALARGFYLTTRLQVIMHGNKRRV